jgi:sugar (pentulose or hexulose) kinase
MPRAVGIDIGVSFIKICFLDKKSISNIKRIESPSSGNLNNSKHEIDSVLFLDIIVDLIDEYLQIDSNIQRIYISTQMHGFVLVDGSSQACSNYISWKDRRSEVFRIGEDSALDWLKKNIPNDILMKTGMGLRSGLPSVNLFVLQRQKKIKTGMSFGTIGDFIVSSLTNTRISTSLSNAAGTGLFDVENNNWNSYLIDMLGLQLNFPILNKKTSTPVGLYKGIKVFPAIGDQQASLLGLERDLSNVAVSNIATGSQVTLTSPKLMLSNSFQTRPYINNTFLLTIPFIPAGRVLNSLVNLLKEVNNKFFGGNIEVEEVWRNLINYTNKIDLNEGSLPTLRINTDFIGSFSIDGGKIDGIDESNFTVNEIILAFILDIANNHAISLRVLKKYKEFDTVLMSGGVSERLPIIKEALRLRIKEEIVSSSIKEDALNGLRVLSIENVESW